jgi:CheY-like chemotaxis protein
MGMRILVCDDNVDAADALAIALRAEGYDVSVFYDGRECLEKALEWNPDVAFLDIGLPTVTGYGVAKALRDRYGDAILLVAVSGYDAPEDRAAARASGFDLHLVKPADISQIMRIAACAA